VLYSPWVISWRNGSKLKSNRYSIPTRYCTSCSFLLEWSLVRRSLFASLVTRNCGNLERGWRRLAGAPI
jgi:hypothetical protein